jgi:PAS domain S-box-containing protein
MTISNENETWKATFDGINDGICILSPDQRIIRCNRYFTGLFGLHTEAIIGRPCYEVMHKTAYPVLGCPVEKMKRTLRRETMELSIGDRWFVVTADPILDDAGTLMEILHIVRDITENKLVEKELRESEERFRRIFDQGPLAIAMVDRSYRFTKVNSAFCDMLGYTEKELLALSFKDITHPEHINTDIANTERLARNEISFYQTDKRYIMKNGQHRWGALMLSVLRDDEGKFLHYLVMIKDITEQKKMEVELLRTQKLESLGVLAGGIAHDFNNLLAGVFGFMDLARDSLDPGAPAATYLRSAFLAFEKAKALSRQLLTFSKGGAPVKLPVKVDGLLRECCTLAMSGSNVKCSFTIPADLAIVEADENQLSQVFSNILINAREAMPDGGTVAVCAENLSLNADDGRMVSGGDYVAVEIKDEGVGIPDKIIGRIFDPFFSTKKQGSGLGLATSYSIVNRHGGRIEASSTPGAGTTMTVLLPASAKPAAPAGVVPGADDDTGLRGSGRVLVMDDEQGIRELAIAVLSRAGYSVVTASDGAQAIELYRNARNAGDPFGLVILDLTVPGGMGGEKTIIELRKIDPGVVAIVSSGYADSELLIDPATHGFAGMISKPYRANDLISVVKKSIRG